MVLVQWYRHWYVQNTSTILHNKSLECKLFPQLGVCPAVWNGGGGSIWRRKGVSSQQPEADRNPTSAHISCIDAFSLNIYIYNYPEKTNTTFKKWNKYGVNQLLTHPFTLSASKSHYYNHKDKQIKYILATNRENPNLTPTLGGLSWYAKMTTINRKPRGSWNAMTTEAFYFKQNNKFPELYSLNLW